MKAFIAIISYLIVALVLLAISQTEPLLYVGMDSPRVHTDSMPSWSTLSWSTLNSQVTKYETEVRYSGISTTYPTGSPNISSTGLLLSWDMQTLTSGNMKDFSGNSRDGTITATSSVTGEFGNARKLVNAADKIASPNLSLSGNLTLASWVYVPNYYPGGTRTFVSLGTGVADQGAGIGYNPSANGTGGFNAFQWGANSVSIAKSFVMVEAWHSFVMTISVKTITLYIDGINYGSTTNANQLSFTNQPIYAGENTGFSAFVNGYEKSYIDDFASWSRPISASEIAAFNRLGVRHLESVSGTGWVNTTVHGSNAHESFVMAFPTAYRPYNGIAMQFDFLLLAANINSTINSGQYLDIGFMQANYWNQSKCLAEQCSGGGLSGNRVQFVEVYGYTAGNFQLVTYNATDRLNVSEAGQGQGALTWGHYRVYLYGGSGAGDRPYFGMTVWNQDIMQYVNSSFSSDSVPPERDTTYRFLIDVYNGLPDGPYNYYNISFSPIQVATDFSSSESVAPFRTETDWTFYPSFLFHGEGPTETLVNNPTLIRNKDYFIMMYGPQQALVRSTNLLTWTRIGTLENLGESKPELLYLQNNSYIALTTQFGNHRVLGRWSSDLSTWSAWWDAMDCQAGWSYDCQQPGVLKDMVTGAPLAINGKYYMSFYGQGDDPGPFSVGRIGMAESTDLMTWTMQTDPVFVPDNSTAQALLSMSYHGTSLFAWNGSVYLLVNSQTNVDSLPDQEAGRFVNLLARATNIQNYIGTDMFNWTLETTNLYIPNGNDTQVDSKQFYYGEFLLQLNGNLSFWYNGKPWYNGDYIEAITLGSTQTTLPTEVSTTAHIGDNRIVDDRAVAWDLRSANTGISSITNWLDVHVDDWSPSVATGPVANWVAGNGTGTVSFLVSSLTPGGLYELSVDGGQPQSIWSDFSGTLSFDWSSWSSYHSFSLTARIGGYLARALNSVYLFAFAALMLLIIIGAWAIRQRFG